MWRLYSIPLHFTNWLMKHQVWLTVFFGEVIGVLMFAGYLVGFWLLFSVAVLRGPVYAAFILVVFVGFRWLMRRADGRL